MIFTVESVVWPSHTGVRCNCTQRHLGLLDNYKYSPHLVTETLRLNIPPHTTWVAIIKLPTNILSCRKEVAVVGVQQITCEISHRTNYNEETYI